MELKFILAIVFLVFLVIGYLWIEVINAYISLFVREAKGAKAKIIYDWELTREMCDYSNSSKLGWVTNIVKKLAEVFGFSENLIGLFINVKYMNGEIGNLKVSKKLFNKIKQLKFIGDNKLHQLYFKTGRWTKQDYAVSIN